MLQITTNSNFSTEIKEKHALHNILLLVHTQSLDGKKETCSYNVAFLCQRCKQSTTGTRQHAFIGDRAILRIREPHILVLVYFFMTAKSKH